MTIARMWETRLDPERADEFFDRLAAAAWPALCDLPGFAGGEVYRSDDGEHRAVVVTRWHDGAGAAAAAGVEAELAMYAAREPHAWEFTRVEL